MKKIGILTFHASHNNGSMLQALALQRILSEKSTLPVEIIDFSNSEQKNMYSPLPKAKNLKKLIKKMILLLNHKQMNKQFAEYEDFKRAYFQLSDRSFETVEDFLPYLTDYKAIVVGSDQIWNIKCIDADDFYFLDKVSGVLKYAYAVSFGANNPFVLQEKRGKYESLLSEFSAISVRERNAQRWIKQAMETNVDICLDPTMLLNRFEWEGLVDVGDNPIIEGDYIFFYCFSISCKEQKFLKEISMKYHMPVYFMDAREWTLRVCMRNDIKLIKRYGPSVYLNIVKNAKLFVTTSFHGTAFASIYEKCFWYIKNEDANGQDDRALTFLTQMGLLDRYKTINELRGIDLLSGRDYTEPKERLAALQRHSLEYIERMIWNIENE